MILTPLQKLPKNVEDLGKLIVAKGLKKLPKVKKIAQSGHTEIGSQVLKISNARIKFDFSLSCCLGIKLFTKLHSYDQCDQIGRFIGLWATF